MDKFDRPSNCMVNFVNNIYNITIFLIIYTKNSQGLSWFYQRHINYNLFQKIKCTGMDEFNYLVCILTLSLIWA